MGCDIHPILEKKFGDKWVGVNSYDYVTNYQWDYDKKEFHKSFIAPAGDVKNRSYTRFAKFAGVRGDGQPDKGMPEDASDLATMRCEEYGEDGHSHSWLMLREALEHCLAADMEQDADVLLKEGDPRKDDAIMFYFGVDIDTEDYDGEGPRDSIDNYRLVFWFDN